MRKFSDTDTGSVQYLRLPSDWDALSDENRQSFRRNRVWDAVETARDAVNPVEGFQIGCVRSQINEETGRLEITLAWKRKSR